MPTAQFVFAVEMMLIDLVIRLSYYIYVPVRKHRVELSDAMQ